MNSTCDVLVVGASIAGAVVASGLAQRGASVVIIDRSGFPRRKPCGEGLSRRGYEELVAAGLGDAVHGVWLDGYRIHDKSRTTTLGHEAAVLGVRRFDLDAALLALAERCPQLTVCTGEGIVSVQIQGGGGFAIQTTKQVIRPRFLVAADGVDSRTLTMLGVQRISPRKIRYGLSSSWTIQGEQPSNYVETFLLSGGELFLTPVGDGFMNVSFLGSKKLISALARREYRTEVVTSCAEALGLSLLPYDHPMGAAAVNAGFRAAYLPAGTVAVGDACESFDPVGGMGMTHAVISGRAAARQIMKALEGEESSDALAAYAAQRERSVRKLRGFTRITGIGLGTWYGRRLLPALVQSGIAAEASKVVHHGATEGWTARLLNLCGRNLSFI